MHKPWNQCPDDEIEIGDIIDSIGPEDVVLAWITQLRSGRHTQCIGQMRRLNEDGSYSYDALGVLCLTCIAMGIEDINDEEWSHEAPPKRTTTAAGFRTRLADNGMGESRELSVIEKINDRGDTFEQIADILEAREEGLDIRRASI